MGQNPGSGSESKFNVFRPTTLLLTTVCGLRRENYCLLSCRSKWPTGSQLWTLWPRSTTTFCARYDKVALSTIAVLWSRSVLTGSGNFFSPTPGPALAPAPIKSTGRLSTIYNFLQLYRTFLTRKQSFIYKFQFLK